MLTPLDVSMLQSSFPSVFNGFDGPDGEVPVDVTMGRDVALECMIRDASPLPRIQWFMDDDIDGDVSDDILIDTSEDSTRALIRAVEDGRYLVIRDLNADRFSNTYHCAVTIGPSEDPADPADLQHSPTTYVLQDVGKL